MQESLSNKVVNSVRWTTVNSVCLVGFQILTVVILGRLLNPEEFGLMAMIMVFVGFTEVFAKMGLGEAIIYKKDINRNELSSLYFINIFVGFVLFLGFFFCSGLISSLYSEPDIVPLVKIMSSVFFISSLGIIFEILLRKYLLFSTLSKIHMFSIASSFVLMVVLAWQGAGVYALVLGQVFLRTINAALLIFVASRKKWFPNMHFNFAEIKFYLKFGAYRIAAMSINGFNSRVDQLLIGAMLGSVILGSYNIAFRIIYLPVEQVNPILTHVAFPFFSIIQDETLRLKQNFLKYTNVILSINTPVLAGITAIAPVLIPLVLGDKWNDSIPIIQAMSLYVFFRAIFNASGSLMMAKGKANWSLYWNIIMLFIIPSTTYAALKASESAVVVCLALGGIFFVFFFFHYALILRNLLGPFFKEYVLAIARPFALSASMGLFTYLLYILLKGWPYIVSAPILVIFGAVYYAIMTMYFNPLFVDELERVLPSKLSRSVQLIRIKLRWSYR